MKIPSKMIDIGDFIVNAVIGEDGRVSDTGEVTWCCIDGLGIFEFHAPSRALANGETVLESAVKSGRWIMRSSAPEWDFNVHKEISLIDTEQIDFEVDEELTIPAQGIVSLSTDLTPIRATQYYGGVQVVDIAEDGLVVNAGINGGSLVLTLFNTGVEKTFAADELIASIKVSVHSTAEDIGSPNARLMLKALRDAEIDTADEIEEVLADAYNAKMMKELANSPKYMADVVQDIELWSVISGSSAANWFVADKDGD